MKNQQNNTNRDTLYQNRPNSEESGKRNKKYRRIRRSQKCRTSNLKIIHANARGLISKMQSIQSVLDEIEADNIAITETKLNTDRNINIPGYKWIGRPRLSKEGGGVGVFVKQEITQSTTIHKIGEDNLEIIWIRICLRKKKNCILECTMVSKRQERRKKK